MFAIGEISRSPLAFFILCSYSPPRRARHWSNASLPNTIRGSGSNPRRAGHWSNVWVVVENAKYDTWLATWLPLLQNEGENNVVRISLDMSFLQ